MIKRFIKKIMPTEMSAPINEVLFLCKRPFYRYVAIKKFNRIGKIYAGKVKIEIGAGDKKGENGWFTIDISKKCDIYWDLRWAFPFPNNSVDMIYSSHVLEHFCYKDLVKLMKECHRILKPSGQFSACVPNAGIYINGYSEDQFDRESFCKYEPALNNLSKIGIINYIAYMDGHHRHMFDSDELSELLKSSGFVSVERRGYDQTIDSEERNYESIYVIGYKPEYNAI